MLNDYQPKPASFQDLVVSPVRGIPKWDDYTQAVEQAFQENVEGPVLELESLRYLEPGVALNTLQKTARLLGFNLNEEVLDSSNNNLLRVVTQLPLYYDSNGTNLFIKFIDLVLNAETEIEKLWTEDHVNFFNKPRGPLLVDGGTWYLSTHVDIFIRLINPTYVVLTSLGLVDKIKNLFYQNSPIELVIQRFYFVVNTKMNIPFATINKKHKDMHEITVGEYAGY